MREIQIPVSDDTETAGGLHLRLGLGHAMNCNSALARSGLFCRSPENGGKTGVTDDTFLPGSLAHKPLHPYWSTNSATCCKPTFVIALGYLLGHL